MNRFCLFLLLLAVAAAAQTSFSGTLSRGSSDLLQLSGDSLSLNRSLFGDPKSIASPAYIARWETSETCYECSFRYAVYCSTGSDPACGVPSKTVEHWAGFESIDDLLKFVNDRDLRVTGVWSTKALKIDVRQIRKETPQPPKVDQQRVYSIRL